MPWRPPTPAVRPRGVLEAHQGAAGAEQGSAGHAQTQTLPQTAQDPQGPSLAAPAARAGRAPAAPSPPLPAGQTWGWERICSAMHGPAVGLGIWCPGSDPCPSARAAGVLWLMEGGVRAGGAWCCPSMVSPLQAWKGLQGTFRAPRGQHKGLPTHPRASLLPAAVSWLCRAVGARRMPPAVPLPNGFTRTPPLQPAPALGFAGLLLAGPSAARRGGLGTLTGGHCRGLSQQLPAAPQNILRSHPSVPPRLKCSGGNQDTPLPGSLVLGLCPHRGMQKKGGVGQCRPSP